MIIHSDSNIHQAYCFKIKIMKKIIRIFVLAALLPLVSAGQSGSKGSFSFHWAFTNYCLKNVNMKYQHNGQGIVITSNQNNNNFPEALKTKTFPPAKEIIYSKNTKIPIRDYAFVYVDGTQKLEDVLALHDALAPNIVMFIHRNAIENKNDPKLMELLKRRPTWLYYGNPYEPNAFMTRSGKEVFTENNISLNRDAPGGN